jgi:hypothetical protein
MEWGSSGDGMGVMLLLILGAMVAMVLAGFAVFFGIGLLLSKTTKAGPKARTAIMIGFGAIGMLAGTAWMMSTFMENDWNPPPELRVTVPPGYDAPFIVLIEDSVKGQALTLSGGSLPMTTPVAEIAMPSSGILRLKSFGELAGNGNTQIVFSDGSTSSAMSSGPAPTAIGGSAFLVFEREPPNADPSAPSIDLPRPDELARYVLVREGAATVNQ